MFAKQTCHGAKRSMLASRRNVVCTIFRLRTNERITHDLGRGGACSSRRFVLILCMRREQAPALRFITICGAPPLCLFLPFVFFGQSRTPVPTMNKGVRTIFWRRTNKRSLTNLCRGRRLRRPKKTLICNGQSSTPRIVVTLSFGFAQINGHPQTL